MLRNYQLVLQNCILSAAFRIVVTPSEENSSTEDDTDELLKKPVVKIDTVKIAISKQSETRLKYFRTHSLKMCMQTYPYLRSSELVRISCS